MGKDLEINVNDQNFEDEVIKASSTVLVDFWAEWCGPCKMIAPIIGEIAREYEGKLKVCKLNVEEGPQTSSKYGVMNIPTLILFKGGQPVDKIIGVVPKNDMSAKIDAHI